MAKHDNQDENRERKRSENAVESYLKKLEQSIKREQNIYNESEALHPAPVRPRRIPRPKPPPQDDPPEAEPAPAPEPEPVNHQPAPPVQKPAAPQPAAAADHRPGVFEQGDILKIEDGTIAVYQGPVPGKEYDIVYFLLPDGRADARGVMIYAYDCEKIGNLPPQYFDKLRHLMLWNRDLLVYHLDRYEWCKQVPVPANPELIRAPDKTPIPHRTPAPRPSVPAEYQTGPQPPAAAPDKRPEQMLQKGRRMTLKMGAKEWNAVYWGRDDLGNLLAHQTHGEWSLLHMDLDRFGSAIQYGSLLTPNEIKKMESSILKTHSE